MTLSGCRECGSQISTKAKTCPHCGVSSQTGCRKVIEPRTLREIPRWSITFVIACACIDQDRMSRRLYDVSLIGDHHTSGYRIKDNWIHLFEMAAANLRIIGRKHILRSPPRSVSLDDAGNCYVTDFKRPHAFPTQSSCFVLPIHPAEGGAGRRKKVCATCLPNHAGFALKLERVRKCKSSVGLLFVNELTAVSGALGEYNACVSLKGSPRKLCGSNKQEEYNADDFDLRYVGHLSG